MDVIKSTTETQLEYTVHETTNRLYVSSKTCPHIMLTLLVRSLYSTSSSLLLENLLQALGSTPVTFRCTHRAKGLVMMSWYEMSKALYDELRGRTKAYGEVKDLVQTRSMPCSLTPVSQSFILSHRLDASLQ